MLKGNPAETFCEGSGRIGDYAIGLTVLSGYSRFAGLGVAAGICDIGHGSRKEDGGECAYDYTSDHGEDKRADGIAAKDEDTQKHEQG